MSNKINIEEDIEKTKDFIEYAQEMINDMEYERPVDVTISQKDISSIENILADRERLAKENNNLNNILKSGLSKEKQYCFNEDGNTGKCLGYGIFFDDEPCEYCKTCERLNIKEDY